MGSTAGTTGADGRLSDAARLRRLADTGLLDAAPCPSLDRLARAAAHQVRTAAAQISLIAADRRVVAGQAGPAVRHTFCRLVVDSDAPLLVSDARTDDRVAGHPALGNGVIAYAGFPVRSGDGYPLGAFCVLHDQPRDWEPRDLLLVEDLAAAAQTEIRLRAEARTARRLQGVLDACQDAYVSIDLNGAVQAWNAAAERLFGYPVADALGRQVSALIIPERFRPAHEAGLARLRAGHPSVLAGGRVELAARNRAGGEFPIEMTLQVDGELYHAFLHDITAKHRAATGRELRLAVARALADATSAEQAADGTLAAVAHALGWAFGEFWQADDEAGRIARVGHWISPEHDLSAVTADRPFSVPHGVGLAGHIWATGTGLWAPEVADDPRLLMRRDQIRQAGLHSAIGLPIRSADRILGVLLLFSVEVEEPDAEVLELLDGVCGQLGRYFERRRAEDLALALAAARRDFDRVIEQVEDYVWTVEVRPDGSIHPVYGSPGGRLVIGPPADHPDLADAMDGRVHPDDRAAAEELPRKVLAGEAAENEVRMIGPDGAVRWIWTRAIPRREGGRLLVDGISTDVTDRRQLAEQRERLLTDQREQNDRLRRLDRLKDELVALVSHELRNPLGAIRNYAEELLLDDTLSADQRHLTEVIDKHSAHMQNLVDDLLDMARLEDGSLRITPAPIEIGALVRDVLQSQQPAAAGKSLTVAADAPEHLAVRADPTRLRQVLDNLLSNAVKYTPSGGRVTITAERVADEVRVTVTDSGIGIPDDQYDLLFDRFFRASNAIKQGIKGTGLGLAITKTIVEAHGGRITAAPATGGGCCFTVALPALQ
ncbi:ATP-binding protein [Paractinoplanes rishiriensis]|uniref:ATP-binding protein n=1 Tax=Paractinoplanes rishiriensis TaxID=1050105 RepID=UPI001943E4F7|nr:ATP-binding protein [Actinoplanes rishiriensis]